MAVTATILASCGGAKTTTAEADKFDYTVEQFADLQILRYKVPEFETLTLKQKELVYYLTQAALEGRDILFDQNGKYNLRIRRMLEAVYTNYKGDKSAPDFKNMEVYLKRVWFSNGTSADPEKEFFEDAFGKEAKMDGIARQDWLDYIGPAAPAYLAAYSRMQLQKSKVSMSFSALLFGPFYFFYRKAWKPAFPDFQWQ